MKNETDAQRATRFELMFKRERAVCDERGKTIARLEKLLTDANTKLMRVHWDARIAQWHREAKYRNASATTAWDVRHMNTCGDGPVCHHLGGRSL